MAIKGSIPIRIEGPITNHEYKLMELDWIIINMTGKTAGGDIQGVYLQYTITHSLVIWENEYKSQYDVEIHVL